jgi:hypothetical protein
MAETGSACTMIVRLSSVKITVPVGSILSIKWSCGTLTPTHSVLPNMLKGPS